MKLGNKMNTLNSELSSITLHAWGKSFVANAPLGMAQSMDETLPIKGNW